LKNIRLAFDQLVDPVLAAIRRELSAIIARLHRIDFGNNADPMSGMGGSSLYMKDLAEKLSFIKGEILSKYNVAETGQTWFVV
jgi:galactokinase/mevalonate kinase-like predicted kinase